MNTEETINERGDYWHPDPDKDRKLGGPGPNQRAREDRAASKSSSSSSSSDNAKPKLKPGESYMEYSKRMKTQPQESVEIQEEKRTLVIIRSSLVTLYSSLLHMHQVL